MFSLHWPVLHPRTVPLNPGDPGSVSAQSMLNGICSQCVPSFDIAFLARPLFLG